MLKDVTQMLRMIFYIISDKKSIVLLKCVKVYANYVIILQQICLRKYLNILKKLQ